MAPEHKQAEHQPFLKYSDRDELPPTHHDASTTYLIPQTRARSFFSYSMVAAATSLIWLIILGITTTYPITPLHPISTPENRHNITSHAHLLTCGNDTAAALQANCKYDPLLNHWVPSPCYDEDFILSYQDDDSWFAYADANLTQRIETVEEMGMRESYWTSLRDHINHCGMLWRKQFVVLFEERREFDTLVASQGHTDHCAQYLVDVLGNYRKEGEVSTLVEVGFAGCWIRD